MRRALAFLLVLSAGSCEASSANAQTSDCTWTLTGWSCSAGPSPTTAAATIANAFKLRRQQQTAAAAFQAALSAGRCDEARSLAVQFGNADDVAAANRCVAPADAEREEQERQRKANEVWMSSIASAVQAGRCEDAKAIALGAGRLDVADQAVRLCKPVETQK